MDLFDKFTGIPERHGRILEAGQDPLGICMDDLHSATEAVVDGRDIVLAGTNNYLGLTFDPECIAAARETLERLGTGTTGSRIANGTYAEHRRLETDLADFYGYTSALVFSTGYQANLGTIAGLAGPGDTILIDADSHACIYDGCKLSGATVIRFRHNSPEDLEKRLARLEPGDTNRMVVVEGLYSMFGDTAPLAEFAEIKRKHGAYLYVDEAHSLGIYGEHGRGVVEQEGVLEQTDFVVGTFSKSLGSIGGFAVSSHPMFAYLRFASRPYMFSASMSPSMVASVTAALGRIRTDPELRHRLWSNAEQLHGGLTALGLELAAPVGPIVAVKVESEEKAVTCWNKLLDAGVYVNLAIPPGTPNSTSLLRCSVSTAHTPAQIDRIIEAFGGIVAAASENAAA